MVLNKLNIWPALMTAVLTLLSPTAAFAVVAPVYVDTNTNGQFDAGETSAAFTGGNNGSTHTRRFDLPADRVTAQDSVVVNFTLVDNSASIAINGTNVFAPSVGQFENTGTGETRLTIGGTYLTQPWVANTNGLPRVRVTISPTGITVQGTRTTTSTALETMVATTGGFVIPGFVNGQNTIVIVNPNGGGPDQISGTISANFTALVRGIQLTKTPNTAGVSSAGTSVTYTLGVTNAGNVPITGITLSDSITSVICPTSGNATIASLAVGATVNCTATYSVTLADMDSRGGGDGDVDNNAAVSGSQQGVTVTANANASVALTFNPTLSIDKSLLPTTPLPLTLNQTISYYYDVTNTGNVTLTNVNISDVHGGNNTAPVPQNEIVFTDGPLTEASTDTTPNDGFWSVIRPGDTVRFTGTYQVSQDDIDLLQ